MSYEKEWRDYALTNRSKITALEKRLNTQRDAINNRNYKSIRENEKQIAELKEPIELLKRFQQGYIDRIISLEEVLRAFFIKSKNRVYIERNQFDKWLEKLDSKTEKKQYTELGFFEIIKENSCGDDPEPRPKTEPETDPTKGKQWVRYEVVNELLNGQIEEFVEKIDNWLQNDDCDGIKFLMALRREYERRLK